jgi:hypothetical protein
MDAIHPPLPLVDDDEEDDEEVVEVEVGELDESLR